MRGGAILVYLCLEWIQRSGAIVLVCPCLEWMEVRNDFRKKSLATGTFSKVTIDLRIQLSHCPLSFGGHVT